MVEDREFSWGSKMQFSKTLTKFFAISSVLLMTSVPAHAQNIIVRTSTTTLTEAPDFEMIEEDEVTPNLSTVVASHWRAQNTTQGCTTYLSGTYDFWGEIPNSALNIPTCPANGKWSIVELKDNQGTPVGFRGECWIPLVFGLYLPNGTMVYSFLNGGFFNGTPASPAQC